MRKKRIQKYFYLLTVMIMVIGQMGIVQIAHAQEKKKDSSTKETSIYHDYDAYQKALTIYNEEYKQYEESLAEYTDKKQEHDDIQAEADIIEKENAEKKTAYEKAMAQYQKELEEYNKKKEEVDDHINKGQYTGPGVYGMYAQLETYLTDYAAITQMADSGMSLSGENLSTRIHENMVVDPFTGSSTVQGNVQEMIDQWNLFAEFERSIGASAYSMGIEGVTEFAIGGAWYSGYKGVEFYHTFSSTTGETVDNIPSILDHPTEENVKQALASLFIETNNAAFDAANQQMDKNKFLVDTQMVDKWTTAVIEAKTQGFDLYTQAIEQYIEAFKIYNNSEYAIADYNTFMEATNAAAETQKKAMNLIGGLPDVGLEDSDNSAPFYTDLTNLSASDLANKYGYLKLLSNMASEATYGYFHLLTPNSGEIISVATASSWSVGYDTFKPTTTDYTPKLIPPVEPVSPVYEVVPIVPEEPVPPIPPIQPIYEPLNQIRLLKVDKETHAPLANAEFELVNSDSGVKIGKYSSGTNGLLKIDNVDPGNYELIETKAPEGYIIDRTPISFIIYGTENETIQLEKQNSSITGSVELTKLDDSSGEVLQGAVFEIRNDSGDVERSGLQTNAEGKISVNGLKIGNYEFIETKAPTGYELDSTPIKFTIKKTQEDSIKLSMTNKITPGGVVISKLDSKSAERLQGAVFELQTRAGDVLQSGLTTDASGKVAVDELKPGEYQFVETTAPTGYKLDDTPLLFTIKKGQTEAVQVSMKNQLLPGGVVLSKTDSKSGEVLQGAVFELQTRTGSVLQSGLVTDTSGKIAVDGLEPGEYQFVETTAPTGYELDETPVLFAIEKGQKEAVQVSMKNKLTPGGAVLSKLDSKSGEALQGAIFDLQTKTGEILQSGLTTDASGKVAVDGLEPGAYQFVETTAPIGYVLDQTPVAFVIRKGQTQAVQLSMTNTSIPGKVVVNKLDSKSGEALQGAVFELQTKTGEVLQHELTTDTSGKIVITGLEPEAYQLVETKAPTGYELDETPVSFVIKKGQTEAIQLSITNKKVEGSIILQKYDNKTGNVLAGAVFEVQDEHENVLLSHLTTDQTGKIAVENLKPGTYYFVETKAPAGYKLDKTPIKFTVQNKKETPVVNIENKGENHSLKVMKRDANNKSPLQGAEFTLYDKSGKEVSQGLVTDEAGTFSIEELTEGDYFLKETHAPKGYKLDDKKVPFTISDENDLTTVNIYNTKLENTLNDSGNGNSSTKKLPKTGEQNPYGLSVVGLLVIICLGGYYKRNQRTKK